MADLFYPTFRRNVSTVGILRAENALRMTWVGMSCVAEAYREEPKAWCMWVPVHRGENYVL